MKATALEMGGWKGSQGEKVRDDCSIAGLLQVSQLFQHFFMLNSYQSLAAQINFTDNHYLLQTSNLLIFSTISVPIITP